MEANGHSGVSLSMELVRVKQEAEWASAGEAREPERLDVEPDTQQRVEMLTEHIKLESDFKEEPASDEPMNWKQDPDSAGASSFSDHESDRLRVKLESEFKDEPASECEELMSVKQESDSDSAGSNPDLENDGLSDSNQTVYIAVTVQDTSSTPADQSRAESNAGATGQRQTSDTRASVSNPKVASKQRTKNNHQIDFNIRAKKSHQSKQVSHVGENIKRPTKDIDTAKDIEETFKCDTCGQTFREIFFLSSHMKLHEYDVDIVENSSQVETTPYSCNICKEHFDTQYHLNTHKILKHVVTIVKAPETYPCDFCEKTFTTAAKLRCHTRVHTGEKPYECNVCNKRFSLPCNRTVHQRLHTGEKPYSCEVCNRRFRRFSDVKAHKQTHIRKPYDCDECDEKFYNEHALSSHKRFHTGDRLYSCQICNKTFSQIDKLRNHTKNLHSETVPEVKRVRKENGKNTFSCATCGKIFKHRRSIYGHDCKHTDTKRFSCALCKRQFHTLFKLKDHVRSHTREKPFSCEICKRSFARSRTLKAHSKTHAREKIEPVNTSDNRKCQTDNSTTPQYPSDSEDSVTPNI